MSTEARPAGENPGAPAGGGVEGAGSGVTLPRKEVMKTVTEGDVERYAAEAVRKVLNESGVQYVRVNAVMRYGSLAVFIVKCSRPLRGEMSEGEVLEELAKMMYDCCFFDDREVKIRTPVAEITMMSDARKTRDELYVYDVIDIELGEMEWREKVKHLKRLLEIALAAYVCVGTA